MKEIQLKNSFIQVLASDCFTVRESIQKHIFSPIQNKMEFKRSDEIVKTITVNEIQITSKRSAWNPKSKTFRENAYFFSLNYYAILTR